MAITNAQQYQQLVNKPADGKRPGYRGPGGYQGREDTGVERPGQDKTGPERQGRDRDFQQRGESKEKYKETSKEYRDRGTQQVYGRSQLSQQQKKDLEKREAKKREENRRAKEEAEKFERIQKQKKELSELGKRTTDIFGNVRKKTTDAFLNRNKYAALQKLGLIRTPGFTGIGTAILDSVTGEIPEQFRDLSFEELKDIATSGPYLGAYDRNEKTFAKGLDQLERTMDFEEKGDYSQSAFDAAFPNVRKMVSGNDGPGGDGRDNQIIPPIVPTTTAPTTTTPQVVDNRTELEKLLDARGPAYRFFADGGMADDDDPVGGIMDLESGRQMYFLGKLVKKATKTIKKIAKSPVGKLALGAAALKFGSPFLKSEGLKNFFFKGGEMGLGNLTQRGLLTGILGTSALAGLMTPKQEEDEEQYLGPTLDIPAIRRDPYGAMGGAYSFYAEGGKAEPVAKKTMPLIDMDGMEKDYRETGGFVEMGRMERADDVPARLSKNEFVFTADAVRNAGEGDIDKGAEVMYNMMKNLESGGEVSEESQGLEGARKMFQTSQRLGEVI